jgi:hypothetical protein
MLGICEAHLGRKCVLVQIGWACWAAKARVLCETARIPEISATAAFCTSRSLSDSSLRLASTRIWRLSPPLHGAPWRGVNLKHGTWCFQRIKTSDPEKGSERLSKAPLSCTNSTRLVSCRLSCPLRVPVPCSGFCVLVLQVQRTALQRARHIYCERFS